MGINFYARVDTCECCKRYEELHIGKASCGWTFSFQAIDDKDIKIKSYSDWLKFLGKENVVIYDEEKRLIKLEEFMDMIIRKKDEVNKHTEQYPEGNFLDKDGHSFSIGYFS